MFLASLVPNILVANNNVPDKTLADVIETAKKTPGGIDMASSGNGTLQHLCLEMLKHMAKVPINHVPYRGGGPALNDIVGGQIKYYFSNGSASVGLIQGGKVKPIVHTGKGRLGTLPDLPAAQDTIPGFEGYEWNGVFVPAGTSPDIIKKLNAGLNEVLQAARHHGAVEAAQHRLPRQHAGRIPRLRGGGDRRSGARWCATPASSSDREPVARQRAKARRVDARRRCSGGVADDRPDNIVSGGKSSLPTWPRFERGLDRLVHARIHRAPAVPRPCARR